MTLVNQRVLNISRNTSKTFSAALLFSAIGLLQGCFERNSQPSELQVENTTEMQTPQSIEPKVVASYSQCQYHESEPKVDVVREIDLTGIIAQPAFGGKPPVAPELAKGRVGVWFYLGQRPTTGYGIKLDNQPSGIVEGELTLWINEIQPNPGKLYAQMLTSPCVLLSINDISFNKLTVKGNASGLPIGLALE